MRHVRTAAAGTAFALLLAAAPAHALPPGIYVTDKAIDPATSMNYEKELKASRLGAIAANPDNGKWHVFFVAYLPKPAPADQLNLVFYEANVKGKQEPNAFPINTKQGARIVSSDTTVSAEDGIKPGPYLLKLTLLVGGKEQVLASTKLTLKPPAPAPATPAAPAN